MQTSLLNYYRYTHFKLNNISQTKLETPFCTTKEKISLEEDELTENVKLFLERFRKYLPKKEKENDMSHCIKESMRKLERKNLYEKYITSIYIILNKEEIRKNRNLLRGINMVFIRALIKEKQNLEKTIFALNNNLNSIYININIFIGLLINIISIFEIFDIKNFVKNNFKPKLNDIYIFLKNYLIPNFIYPNPIYANISLDFLLKKIESLLLKIKAQEECYLLSQDIFNFLKNENEKFLSKKRMRGSSQSKKNTKNKKNKRVSFDLNKNVIHIFNKDEIIAKLV